MLCAASGVAAGTNAPRSRWLSSFRHAPYLVIHAVRQDIWPHIFQYNAFPPSRRATRWELPTFLAESISPAQSAFIILASFPWPMGYTVPIIDAGVRTPLKAAPGPKRARFPDMRRHPSGPTKVSPRKHSAAGPARCSHDSQPEGQPHSWPNNGLYPVPFDPPARWRSAGPSNWRDFWIRCPVPLSQLLSYLGNTNRDLSPPSPLTKHRAQLLQVNVRYFPSLFSVLPFPPFFPYFYALDSGPLESM